VPNVQMLVPPPQLPLGILLEGTESTREVVAAKMLRHCVKGTAVYPDGALAWQQAAQAEKRLSVPPC
jgi:hypothetical protein